MCIRDRLKIARIMRNLESRIDIFNFPDSMFSSDEINNIRLLDRTDAISNETSDSLKKSLYKNLDYIRSKIVSPSNETLHQSLIEDWILTLPLSIQNLQMKAISKCIEDTENIKSMSRIVYIGISIVAIIVLLTVSAYQRYLSRNWLRGDLEELQNVDASRIQEKSAGTIAFIETLQSRNMDSDSTGIIDDWSLDSTPQFQRFRTRWEVLFWLVFVLALVGLIFVNSEIDDRFIGILKLNRELTYRNNAVHMFLPLIYQSIASTNETERYKVKSRLSTLKEKLLQSANALSRDIIPSERLYVSFLDKVELLEKNICSSSGVIRHSRLSKDSCIEIINEGLGQGLNANLLKVFEMGWDLVSLPKDQLNASERFYGREMSLIEKALKFINPALGIENKVFENMRDGIVSWPRFFVIALFILWLVLRLRLYFHLIMRIWISKDHLLWTLH
eukprot:TRINITY_DN6359_c0_g2_i5.p1 TRINITY_DN6359_c0_g2~~TRINITY_DN6359_c0_g2_i5.p1  ORF type:complete len:477 (-),score=26.07 TRINITY_DN6359_c0_g2_i5:63-1403(-)